MQIQYCLTKLSFFEVNLGWGIIRDRSRYVTFTNIFDLLVLFYFDTLRRLAPVSERKKSKTLPKWCAFLPRESNQSKKSSK